MAVTRIACLVGDFYHDPTSIQTMLEAVISELDGMADFYTDPDTFPWAGLDAYSVVVISKEARSNPAESAAIWSTEETIVCDTKQLCIAKYSAPNQER